jgi:FlaG/FlaF family flagellin (archaellin)
MAKGVSTIIATILILIITVSLISLVYTWLSSYAPQPDIQNNINAGKGCLKIESVDTESKTVTIRNCGDIALSSIVLFIDLKTSTRYSEALNAGEIAQLSYTENINIGSHEIMVSSNYADSSRITFEK